LSGKTVFKGSVKNLERRGLRAPAHQDIQEVIRCFYNNEHVSDQPMFFDMFIHVTDSQKSVPHTVIDAPVGYGLIVVSDLFEKYRISGIENPGVEMGQESIGRVISGNKKTFIRKTDFGNNVPMDEHSFETAGIGFAIKGSFFEGDVL
jgi:hypothetical protein